MTASCGCERASLSSNQIPQPLSPIVSLIRYHLSVFQESQLMDNQEKGIEGEQE